MILMDLPSVASDSLGKVAPRMSTPVSAFAEEELIPTPQRAEPRQACQSCCGSAQIAQALPSSVSVLWPGTEYASLPPVPEGTPAPRGLPF